MEGLTRRRLSGTIVVGTLLLGLGAGATLARASAGPPEQTGVFALLGGTPKIVSKFWAVHASAPLRATLHVRQFAKDATTPILNYDVEMQKTIHLVVIRDDFKSFLHLHPDFNTTTGTFTQTFTKQPNHRYYVYADTQPHGIGQQVFRFTMDSDGPPAVSPPSAAPSAPAVAAGPYTVRLDSTTLPANQPLSLDITVDKGAAPAHDLGSYLGAPAHCVFINAATLAYVHAHATVRSGSKGGSAMDMQGAGPRMKLHVPALPAGTYKLWIQFRGGSYRVYAAPFTLSVQ